MMINTAFAGLLISCLVLTTACLRSEGEDECQDDDDCGADGQCLAPLPCGINPPFTPCDDSNFCVDCAGPDAAANGCDVPLADVGDACNFDTRCASRLACVEASAGTGGICQEVPTACDAELCSCPGDDLATLCSGARPNDCEGTFVACEGAYP